MKIHFFPRVLSVASVSLLSLSILQAQEPSPGKGERKPPSVEERIERLKKDLELTEEQVGKIKPILEDARSQMEKLREDASADRDAIREKVRKLMDAAREKIDEVLTPEQRAKAEELRAKRKGGGGNQSDKPQQKE